MEPSLRALILNYHQLSLQEQDYVRNQVLSPGDLLIQQYDQSSSTIKAGFQQFLRRNGPIRGPRTNHQSVCTDVNYDSMTHDLPTSRNKQNSDEGDGDSKPTPHCNKDDLDLELDLITDGLEEYSRLTPIVPVRLNNPNQMFPGVPGIRKSPLQEISSISIPKVNIPVTKGLIAPGLGSNALPQILGSSHVIIINENRISPRSGN